MSAHGQREVQGAASHSAAETLKARNMTDAYVRHVRQCEHCSPGGPGAWSATDGVKFHVHLRLLLLHLPLIFLRFLLLLLLAGTCPPRGR
eukprot:4200947-Pyramimonas_sp.AAC.1